MRGAEKEAHIYRETKREYVCSLISEWTCAAWLGMYGLWWHWGWNVKEITFSCCAFSVCVCHVAKVKRVRTLYLWIYELAPASLCDVCEFRILYLVLILWRIVLWRPTTTWACLWRLSRRVTLRWRQHACMLIHFSASFDEYVRWVHTVTCDDEHSNHIIIYHLTLSKWAMTVSAIRCVYFIYIYAGYNYHIMLTLYN